GIPAAELPHVFERFHRVEGARSRTHEGTGIGLALVRELAAMYQGTTDARSELGRGSTFTVRLPLGRRDRSTMGAPPSPSAPPPPARPPPSGPPPSPPPAGAARFGRGGEAVAAPPPRRRPAHLADGGAARGAGAARRRQRGHARLRGPDPRGAGLHRGRVPGR